MNQAPPPVPVAAPPPVPGKSAVPPAPEAGEPQESFLEGNRFLAACASFGISMLAHLVVFSMLAFWIMHTEVESFIAIQSGLDTKKPISNIETLKADMAPLPVKKEVEKTAKKTIVPITRTGPTGGVTIDVPAPDIGTPKPGKGAGGKGKLFGTGREAQTMVFVVDCSGSMSGRRFSLAISELIRVINRLKAEQRFYVVFYSTETIPLFATDSENVALANGRRRKNPLLRPRGRRPRRYVRRLVPATTRYKQRAESWIKRLRAGGGTRPAEALQIALSMKPEVIYFLTDGRIPQNTPQVIREANRHKVRVNTVALGFAGSEDLLKQIARQNNNGTYTYVDE